METLLADLKHAVRMFRQSPGFTAAAVSALALGIGANTAIFSVINTVLLMPLPYPDPARIVALMNRTDPGEATFVPLAQVRDSYMELNNRFMPLRWVVRTHVAPFSLAAPVQRAFQDVADLPVAHIRSMEQIVSHSTSRNQLNATLLGTFAFFAALLASIGLYGLIAYSVEQRTLEFGIRLALGADFRALRNMVMRDAMTLAVIGIGIGLAAAYGLTRLLATMLYGVKPNDPAIFGSVTLLLAGVAFLAAYLPARRALRIDPVVALRYE